LDEKTIFNARRIVKIRKLITELEKMFNENNQSGLIRFDYETEVYYGRFYD
jgi:hypothetical protein